MISPLIEQDEDGIRVNATELTLRASLWGNLHYTKIDSAFITFVAVSNTAEIASMSRVLSKGECLAMAEALTRLANQIPGE